MPIYLTPRSLTFEAGAKKERLLDQVSVRELNAHINAIAQRAMRAGDMPYDVEVHHARAEQNARGQDIAHLSFVDGDGASRKVVINEGCGDGTLLKRAEKKKALAKRISKMPNVQKEAGSLKGRVAKVVSGSEYVHVAGNALAGMLETEHKVDGSDAARKMHIASGALNLTGVLGISASAVNALAATEDLVSLQQEGASVARKAEAAATIAEGVLNAAGYSAITASGGMDIVHLASKVAFLAKLGDLFLGIGSFASGIRRIITFHTRRIFFNTTNQAIAQSQQAAGTDKVARKADAIWIAIHGKISPDMRKIETEVSAFEALSEEEQIENLVSSFEKGLGWHFWKSKPKRAKVDKYSRALTEQLEGLSPDERKNVLVAAKRKVLIRKAENAKAKDAEVIGSKKFSQLMLKEGKEINLNLRHHQWGVIHLYSKMEGEYKSKRVAEVAGIVADLGNGVISVVGFVVPGGIIVTAISAGFSALQVGSSIHLYRQEIAKFLGFDPGPLFDDEVERICQAFSRRHITYLGAACAA